MGLGTLPKPAVAELRVAGDTLYIGVAGPAGASYLYRYEGIGTTVELVPNQPFLNPQTNMGNLKLFTSSNGLLYVGNVDLDVGFYLQVYDPTTGLFREITDNGFFNPYNACAWSMAEINGRVFVGTFNQDLWTILSTVVAPTGKKKKSQAAIGACCAGREAQVSRPDSL
jgi:hypothetical protein